jgi:protein transport protein SEC24
MEYEGAAGGHKKKRAYAAQAYDFGANAQPAGGAPAPIGAPIGASMGVPLGGAPVVGSPQVPQDPLAPQFGQMNLGPQPVQPQAPQMQAPPLQLNQLYPTDLVSQPFNVLELDIPPPQINIPPNVCVSNHRMYTR